MSEKFWRKNSFTKSLVGVVGINPTLQQRLWTAPDSLVESGSEMVQKQCVRTTVRLTIDDETVVVKRHLERSWRHFAKQSFTRSRAERCWGDTWYLIENGYPTPRPIAYLENRLGPLRGNSWYVYQYIHGTTFKDAATENRNQRLLREYVNQLVDIWMLNRKLRINLTDGHPANFVVDATGKMWVIDLDKLQHLPAKADADSILSRSFENTVRGVVGDRLVIEHAINRLGRRMSAGSVAA